MALNTLRDVFEETIKDLYSAEGQIAKALPKMAKGASSPELKKAFEQHLVVTRKQIERLDQVCKEAGISPGGKKCAGMEGLLKEGEEVLKEKGSGPSRDAALIAAAQKVEHYEISGYGSARTFAERLGFTKSAKLLDKTLEEESKTDEKLTVIAERNVNRASEAEAQGEGEKAGGGARKSAAKKGTGAKASSAGAKTSSAGAKASGAKASSTGAKAGASRTAGKAATSAKASGSSTASRSGAASKSSSAGSRSTATKSRSTGSKSAGKSAGKSSKGRSGKSATGKGSAHPTTDHDFIRRWVEERGGSPACVKGTGGEGDIGMLRIDFPGYSGEDSLQHIEWDEFFDKFEEKNLAFLHQDSRAGGGETRFFKLVSRDSVEED